MINRALPSYGKTIFHGVKEKRKNRGFSLYELIEYILCFLLNRIFLFGAMSPLGIAYFASVFPKRKSLPLILAACLGVFTADMGIRVLQYAGSLVIVCAFSLLMEKEFAEHRWLYATVAAASVAVTGFVFTAFNGYLLYDILYQVLEGILTFFAYFIFDKATDLIQNLHKRNVFEPLESLSLLFLCCGAVLSFSCLPYFQGVAHVVSLVVILIIGLTGGASLCCASGIMFGFVNSLTDVLPAQVVAVYAVSALCAGLFRTKGRWGVVIGFFIANACAMMYFNSSANTVISYYHVLLAGVILFLIPDHLLTVLGEAVQTPVCPEDAVARLREIMCDKLKTAALSFQSLAGAFNEAIETSVDATLRDPAVLFDKTADCVCCNCTLVNYCWQKEYSETRQSLLTLYRRMDMRGTASVEDVPDFFKKGCIHLDYFLEVLNKNYEVHKVNLLWAGKVSESRNLIAEQFKNLSSVLVHLQTELGAEPAEGIGLERRITAALDRNGIEAENVRVWGKEVKEVSLELLSCGGERVCSKKVATVLGSVMDMPMVRLPSVCGDKKCRVRFQEQARYAIETGFAQVAGENALVCGDHYMMSQSSDGKYVLALSDGMGKGEEAETQSNTTICLIRQLLAAGFDKETSLKMINSMLMVSSERDNFATADLCLVNLYSGALEFIKIGASNSYVLKDGKVERVECSSLPVGIISHLEADCELKYAQTGDCVIMVTDGVCDVLESAEESLISRIIEAFQGKTPQQLAEDILRGALAVSGGVAKDDMTVLVARLVET